MTALRTLNNTVAKVFNQMALALNMSKAFDTINIHTLIRKLLHTKILGTLMKFITNYTTYRNHISIQRQFKTGVSQGGVLSPTIFALQTYHHPEHWFMSYVLRR